MKCNLTMTFTVLTAALLLSGCGAVQFPKNPASASVESQPMSPTESFSDGTSASPAGSDQALESTGQSSAQGSQTTENKGTTDSTPTSDLTQRIQFSYVNLALGVKPDDTKDMVDHLKENVTAHGGYIKSLSTSLYSKSAKQPTTEETQSGGNHYDTWTTMTIALPPAGADALIKQLSSDYTVITQSETLEDHTDEYKSLLNRQSSLEDEEQQLLSLIKDARDSEKMRSSAADSDFINNIIQLENNLWMTRRELSQCRYGDLDDDNHKDRMNLSFLESMKDMELVNLAVYVDDN